jgi:hypothetical protein
MHQAVIRRDEIEQLIVEIERYLALVALLRREGYEPRWRLEWV